MVAKKKATTGKKLKLKRETLKDLELRKNVGGLVKGGSRIGYCVKPGA
jgi:hypothetical protein